MDLLGILNIDKAQLEKIDDNAYNSYVELESIKDLISSGETQENLIKVFNVMSRELEKYLFSNEFKKVAASKNIKIKQLDGEEEIIIEKVEKVEDLDDILGITKDTSVVVKDETVGKVEEVEEVEEVEQVKEVEGLDDILDGITGYEKDPEDKDEEKESGIFGGYYSSSKSAEITGRESFCNSLAYGNSSNEINYYEDEGGANYMMTLPSSLGRHIISFNTKVNGSTDLQDINIIWRKFFEAGKNAKLYIISEDKEFFNTHRLILEKSTLFVDYSDVEDFSDNKFKYDLYEIEGSEYSDSLFGTSYLNIQRNIKEKWNNFFGLSNNDYYDKGKSESYGLSVVNYLYFNISSYYNKGGFFYRTSKGTFFSPKVNSNALFYETNINFKKFDIKHDKFPNIKLPFRISSEKGLSPVRFYLTKQSFFLTGFCNSGDIVSVNVFAYNYFTFYYGKKLSFFYNNEVVYVYRNDDLIGMIPAENKSSFDEADLVYEIDSFKSELRSVNSNAYDNMLPIDDDIYKKLDRWIYGIDKMGIKLSSTQEIEVPTVDDVEKEKEAVKEIPIVEENQSDEQVEFIEQEIEGLKLMIPLSEGEDLDFINQEIEGLKLMYQLETGNEYEQ